MTPPKTEKRIQIRTKKKSKIKQKKIDKKHNGKQQTSLEIIDSPRDCCRHITYYFVNNNKLLLQIQTTEFPNIFSTKKKKKQSKPSRKFNFEEETQNVNL